MKSSKPKYNFFKIKKGNLKLFGTFLGAAFLFLLLTKLSQVYTQDIYLDIKLSNLDDELVIVNDSTTEAKVTVQAKGFSLLKYMFNNTKTISIDAKAETFKKNNTLFWDIKNKKYKLNPLIGSSIEILDIKPDTITFQYDVLSSKIVPVLLNKDISFTEGYDVLDDFKLSKDSIKIVGSRDIVETIENVQTETFQQKNINKDISKILSLNTLDKIEYIPKEINISGKIRRFTEGQFTLPITLINTPIDKKVNIFPKKVDVIFYIDIENFKSIKPEDFKLVCDFNSIETESQSNLDIQIINSSNVIKRVRLTQNSVEFVISN